MERKCKTCGSSKQSILWCSEECSDCFDKANYTGYSICIRDAEGNLTELIGLYRNELGVNLSIAIPTEREFHQLLKNLT